MQLLKASVKEGVCEIRI